MFAALKGSLRSFTTELHVCSCILASSLRESMAYDLVSEYLCIHRRSNLVSWFWTSGVFLGASAVPVSEMFNAYCHRAESQRARMHVLSPVLLGRI